MSDLKTKYAGKIIDGKAFAENMQLQIAKDTAALKQSGIKPGLAVVLVGDNPASAAYVRNKKAIASKLGFYSVDIEKPASITQQELLTLVDDLNVRDDVHGILVQLPLPKHIDEETILGRVNPHKDIDGFHDVNAGKLAKGKKDGFVPCTPLGCLLLLKDRLGDLSGKKAVVVGRSNIVGAPMANLLRHENCTVTVVHSKTRDLAMECRSADILVAAIGKPKFITREFVKPGATVIDVGINRIETQDGKGRLVGDVDFDDVIDIAGAITPVPGGVGPMTIACLMRNTLIAARGANYSTVTDLAKLRG